VPQRKQTTTPKNPSIHAGIASAIILTGPGRKLEPETNAKTSLQTQRNTPKTHNPLTISRSGRRVQHCAGTRVLWLDYNLTRNDGMVGNLEAVRRINIVRVIQKHRKIQNRSNCCNKRFPKMEESASPWRFIDSSDGFNLSVPSASACLGK